MEIKFKEWFEDYFKRCLYGAVENISVTQNTTTAVVTAELPYSVEVHNEFSYNTKSDINVTVKKLSGTLENDIWNVPYQILFTLKHKVYEEVKSVFDYLVETANEKYNTIKDDSDDDINVFTLFKPYFIIDSNVDLGIDKGITISISANAIFGSFSSRGLAKIENLKIGGSSVDYIQASIGWTPTTNSNGGLLNGTIKSANYNSILTIGITGIPTKSTVLAGIVNAMILNTTLKNTKYTLSFTFNATAYTLNCILTSPSGYSDSINGYPAITLTFTPGE